MSFTNNIPIVHKEEAFSDCAAKKKKITKLIVGAGNGYSGSEKEMRFIKMYFQNKPNQTTKTLSYTKPIKTTNVQLVLKQLKQLIKSSDYQVDQNTICEINGMNIKDRKELKEFFSSI